MKYLSLFSGIGGFELGIQQAYEDIISEKQIQIQRDKSRNGTMPNNKSRSKYGKPSVCVGYSEIDKYAIQIYEKHFNHKNYGDITKIIAKELPDFDLIVGGFPCQSFSIAGKRLGFKDTRGTLFFDIARIIKEKRPKYLLLENVKGLLSHDNGNTFRTILSTLTEMGYDLQWQVLNSKNFGVPQNRERVFIVGHIREEPRPKVFPIGETEQEIRDNHECNKNTAVYFDDSIPKATTRRGRVMDKAGALMVNPRGGIIQLNKPKHSNDRIYSEEGLSPTINTAQGGNRQPFIKTVGLLKENEKPKGNYLPRERVLDGTKGARAVTTSQNQMPYYTDEMQIRRLTPTECERLQGFPDNFTKYGIDEKGEQIEISDTQRYKTLGNAVTVNVIKEIMKQLL